MKKIFAIIISVAMILTMLPTMSFAASSVAKVYDSQGNEKSYYATFKDAAEAVTQGGKIVILEDCIIANTDMPSVECTIEGNGEQKTLTTDYQDIILKSNLIVKNIQLKNNTPSKINTGFKTNGYKLTLENVKTEFIDAKDHSDTVIISGVITLGMTLTAGEVKFNNASFTGTNIVVNSIDLTGENTLNCTNNKHLIQFSKSARELGFITGEGTITLKKPSNIAELAEVIKFENSTQNYLSENEKKKIILDDTWKTRSVSKPVLVYYPNKPNEDNNGSYYNVQQFSSSEIKLNCVNQTLQLKQDGKLDLSNLNAFLYNNLDKNNSSYNSSQSDADAQLKLRNAETIGYSEFSGKSVTLKYSSNGTTFVDMLETLPKGDYTLKATWEDKESEPLKIAVVDQPQSIYVPISTYTIDVIQGKNGAITTEGSNIVTLGSSKTYKITANDGYILKDVIVDDVSVGPKATYTFTTITKDHKITAVFQPSIKTQVTQTKGFLKNIKTTVTTNKIKVTKNGIKQNNAIVKVKDVGTTVDKVNSVVGGIKKEVGGYVVAIAKTPKAKYISTYSKTNKVKVKTKNLTKGKTVYVKARAYVKVGDTKCYTSWSKIKAVKVY